MVCLVCPEWASFSPKKRTKHVSCGWFPANEMNHGQVFGYNARTCPRRLGSILPAPRRRVDGINSPRRAARAAVERGTLQ